MFLRNNINAIIMILLVPAGFCLMMWGGEENAQYGPWLLSYVVGSLGTIVGTKAKKPPTAVILLFFCLLIGAAGCISTTSIPPEIQDLNLKVFVRHDTYVQADTTLTDLDRHVYLRSTTILRKFLETCSDAPKDTSIQPPE